MSDCQTVRGTEPPCSHLVHPGVSLQPPGERAGAGHGLAHLDLALARLSHLDDQRALAGDVLTEVEETLHGGVHRNLVTARQ